MQTDKVGEVDEMVTVRNVSHEAMLKFAETLRTVAAKLESGELRYLSGGMLVHSQEMGQVVLDGKISFIERPPS